MKGKLESQVRQVIKRFTRHDAKTMMKEHDERKRKALMNSPLYKKKKLDDVQMSPHQDDKHAQQVMKQSMRNRCLDNFEERERMYQDEFIENYMRRYEALSKYLVSCYKRQVIDSFMTEQFCDESAQKYTGKYRDLVERALFSQEDWY